MSEAAAWKATLPIGLLGVIPLLGNYASATRAGEFAARDFARDLLESVEPYGIIVTAGDNDTFPLWYAQEVEGIRTDVTVANMSLMNTEWHLKQLVRREAGTFDPAGSIELWKAGADRPGAPLADSTGPRAPAGPWTKPAGSVFTITEAQVDSLPEYARAPEASLKFGSVEVSFGQQQVLDRKDLATIFLIRDNLGKRPIYFSWSAGGFPDQTLGLTPYLVTQGFVRKLYPEAATPKGPVVMSAGMGWMDLDRTKSLLWNAYRWQSAARPRATGWVDPPSRSILELYAVIYDGLGRTLLQQGDTTGAARADSVSAAVVRSLREPGQNKNP
jgi:hypothetical protein